jgi:hypothetical protein
MFERFNLALCDGQQISRLVSLFKTPAPSRKSLKLKKGLRRVSESRKSLPDQTEGRRQMRLCSVPLWDQQLGRKHA